LSEDKIANVVFLICENSVSVLGFRHRNLSAVEGTKSGYTEYCDL